MGLKLKFWKRGHGCCFESKYNDLYNVCFFGLSRASASDDSVFRTKSPCGRRFFPDIGCNYWMDEWDVNVWMIEREGGKFCRPWFSFAESCRCWFTELFLCERTYYYYLSPVPVVQWLSLFNFASTIPGTNPCQENNGIVLLFWFLLTNH